MAEDENQPNIEKNQIFIKPGEILKPLLPVLTSEGWQYNEEVVPMERRKSNVIF